MQFIKTFFFLFFIVCSIHSQQDSLVIQYDESKIDIEQITESDLESYKNDSNFNYVEINEEDSFINKIKRWLRNILTKFYEAIFGAGTAQGFLYFMFNIFPYLLLAFLIFILIKFFLKVNSRHIFLPPNTNNEITFTEEEKIIKNEDILKLINNAIEQKNYRLAIRYYYLLSLKYLTTHKIITWQQQKTNEDYVLEIEKESIKSDFKNITSIYDHVWYGEFNIDEIKFENFKLVFERLNNKIQ